MKLGLGLGLGVMHVAQGLRAARPPDVVVGVVVRVQLLGRVALPPAHERRRTPARPLPPRHVLQG